MLVVSNDTIGPDNKSQEHALQRWPLFDMSIATHVLVCPTLAPFTPSKPKRNKP
jgi:hypothetical protein